MKNKLFRRLISLAIVLVMIVPTLAPVYADGLDAESDLSKNTEIKETSAQILDEMNRASTYSTFYDNHIDDPRPDTSTAQITSTPARIRVFTPTLSMASRLWSGPRQAARSIMCLT